MNGPIILAVLANIAGSISVALELLDAIGIIAVPWWVIVAPVAAAPVGIFTMLLVSLALDARDGGAQ